MAVRYAEKRLFSTVLFVRSGGNGTGILSINVDWRREMPLDPPHLCERCDFVLTLQRALRANPDQDMNGGRA